MKSSQPDGSLQRIDVNGPAHVDALGRVGFARELLEVISLLPAEGGAVVGLEGEWGSGKTWVLDRLDSLNEELSDEQQVLLVRFNPWMVSGSAEIVETYLIQLASELGTTNRRSSLRHGAEIAGKLIEYTGVLSTVKHLAPMANLLLPGSGFLLEAVGHVAGAAASAAKDMAGGTVDRLKKEPGRLSLTAAREAVKKLLMKAERRIAVLVDDLDRLPPAELAAMVQAIKAVADFPNVVYVLAYDPSAAAHALEEALRLRNGEGRRYLEKIVQVPMPVPEVPAFKMQAFAVDRLHLALVAVDATDEKDMDEARARAAALMRSPRDVLRLETRLALSSRKLISEISPADLLLVEAINLKVPHIIKYVHQHQEEILEISAEAHDMNRRMRGDLGDPYEVSEDRSAINAEQLRESKWKARRDAFEQPIEDRHLIGPIRSAVAYLFDVAPRFLHRRELHASGRRIQKLRNWSRWLSVVKHEEIFENSVVSALLRQPSGITKSAAWTDSETFRGFCALAVDLAGETEGVDALAFVEVFAKAMERFDVQTPPNDSLPHRLGPQGALLAMIRADRSHAQQAVERLIGACSVWLSWRVVQKVDQFLDDEDVVRRLVQQWQAKAMAWLRDVSEPASGCAAFDLVRVMHSMGNGAGPLRGALMRIVEHCPRGLEICFCDPSYTDQALQGFVLPDQDLLPEPDVLKAALSRSPGFEAGHQRLLNWRTTPAKPTPTTPDAPAPAIASAPAPACPAASPPPPPRPPPPAPPAPPPRDR